MFYGCSWLEQGLLTRLAEQGQLAAYVHDGFWQRMDMYREMQLLNDLWERDKSPMALRGLRNS